MNIAHQLYDLGEESLASRMFTQTLKEAIERNRYEFFASFLDELGELGKQYITEEIIENALSSAKEYSKAQNDASPILEICRTLAEIDQKSRALELASSVEEAMLQKEPTAARKLLEIDDYLREDLIETYAKIGSPEKALELLESVRYKKGTRLPSESDDILAIATSFALGGEQQKASGLIASALQAAVREYEDPETTWKSNALAAALISIGATCDEKGIELGQDSREALAQVIRNILRDTGEENP